MCRTEVVYNESPRIKSSSTNRYLPLSQSWQKNNDKCRSSSSSLLSVVMLHRQEGKASTGQKRAAAARSSTFNQST